MHYLAQRTPFSASFQQLQATITTHKGSIGRFFAAFALLCQLTVTPLLSAAALIMPRRGE
jgi:hypothetical protein